VAAKLLHEMSFCGNDVRWTSTKFLPDCGPVKSRPASRRGVPPAMPRRLSVASWVLLSQFSEGAFRDTFRAGSASSGKLPSARPTMLCRSSAALSMRQSCSGFRPYRLSHRRRARCRRQAPAAAVPHPGGTVGLGPGRRSVLTIPDFPGVSPGLHNHQRFPNATPWQGLQHGGCTARNRPREHVTRARSHYRGGARILPRHH